MIVTGTAITFISQRCSEERSEKGFQGLGASGDEDGGAVWRHFNQHLWVHVQGMSHRLSAYLVLEWHWNKREKKADNAGFIAMTNAIK